MLYGTSHADKTGSLVIGGCTAQELASTYGTPLFCLDEELIRSNCRKYVASFCSGNKNRVAYAGKALLTMALCQLIHEEGLYLDVVSGGEFWTALKADFPAEHIYFHGNNKTEKELSMAFDTGVGTIVVDNLHELNMLFTLAEQKQKNVSILLRVALGVDAETHKYIQTGQHDSKFGFALGREEFVGPGEMPAAKETSVC